MNDLVDRLSRGEHPVRLMLAPDGSSQILEECLERKYVHLKFTNTRGGTELGVRLDTTSTDLSTANISQRTGTVKFVGSVTLNYVPVRCIAKINLTTLEGQGHLEPLQ